MAALLFEDTLSQFKTEGDKMLRVCWGRASSTRVGAFRLHSRSNSITTYSHALRLTTFTIISTTVLPFSTFRHSSCSGIEPGLKMVSVSPAAW